VDDDGAAGPGCGPWVCQVFGVSGWFV